MTLLGFEPMKSEEWDRRYRFYGQKSGGGSIRRAAANKFMETKSICGNKFPFEYHTISLPVSLENLPNKITFEGNDFLINPFLHVSLVCIGEIIKKHNVLIPDFEIGVINNFCEFSQNNNISVIEYTDDFKFVARDDLKSIIVMCRVPNLDKFFDLINKKYGLEIEYPPTHITLYTLPSKLGIFLTDKGDIVQLTKIIPNPIGAPLK
jgi:hypothetical protein